MSRPTPEALLPGRLLPVLRHAAQVAVRRHAPSTQVSRGVLGHVALDEERRTVRIDAAGDQERGEVQRRLAQLVGILRDGDRVQVDDRSRSIGVVLLRHPAADRADVVPEVLVSGRLDAREDAHRGADSLHNLGSTLRLRWPCPRRTWSPVSWRGLPRSHQPDWPDEEQPGRGACRASADAAARVRGRGARPAATRSPRSPPAARSCCRPATAPSRSTTSRRATIREKLKILLQMSAVLTYGGHAAGREGGADRRPVREAALGAHREHRRRRAAVVPRAHGQRRRADRRGPHARSRTAWCRPTTSRPRR